MYTFAECVRLPVFRARLSSSSVICPRLRCNDRPADTKVHFATKKKKWGTKSDPLAQVSATKAVRFGNKSKSTTMRNDSSNNRVVLLSNPTSTGRNLLIRPIQINSSSYNGKSVDDISKVFYSFQNGI